MTSPVRPAPSRTRVVGSGTAPISPSPYMSRPLLPELITLPSAAETTNQEPLEQASARALDPAEARPVPPKPQPEAAFGMLPRSEPDKGSIFRMAPSRAHRADPSEASPSVVEDPGW